MTDTPKPEPDAEPDLMDELDLYRTLLKGADDD